MEEQYTEKPENKGGDENVARYLREIELSLKGERSWRKDAESAWKVYRSNAVPGSEKKQKDTFNILWANTEIKRHNLYNALPEPDIRPRHARKDPVSEAVSELLERSVSYTLECQDVHEKMKLAVMDMLVPGRGGLRVRLNSKMEGDEVAYQECLIEHYQWDRFIRGPGKEEDEVPWDAWEHEFTKDEIAKRFPQFVDKLSYDITDQKDDSDNTVFKKTTVYELWDKEEKKVYWLGKDYKDSFLKVVDDPLELKNWFPRPKPLYAIEDSSCLTPLTEYGQYQTQAEELEKVSRRRNKIIDAIRARYVYDSRFKEVEQLVQADDVEMIPAEGVAAILESGGLDKAIWGLPLNDLSNVYQILGQQRNELVSQIYELTGISDILRGDTNPNETAKAQGIKANFATSRLERQKQAVEIFSRDLIRLIVEIVSEFSRETLSLMTGMEFITAEQQMFAKQQMQMLQGQLQQYQQFQQQPPPQIQQQMQQLQAQAGQVTWEQIEEILHSDLLRDYRIDIETDSTISTDKQREQEAIGAYLHSMGQFSRMMQDGMASGLIPAEAARKTLAAVSRKFNLGSEIAEIYEEPIQPRPDPEAEKAKAEQQMEQQRHQMDMQAEQQKQQLEMQKSQMELQIEQQKAQMEMQLEKMRMALEQQRMQMEMMMMRMEMGMEQKKLGLEGEKLEMQEEAAEAQHRRKMSEASRAGKG